MALHECIIEVGEKKYKFRFGALALKTFVDNYGHEINPENIGLNELILMIYAGLKTIPENMLNSVDDAYNLFDELTTEQIVTISKCIEEGSKSITAKISGKKQGE